MSCLLLHVAFHVSPITTKRCVGCVPERIWKRQEEEREGKLTGDLLLFQ